jgi:hypothetical protein
MSGFTRLDQPSRRLVERSGVDSENQACYQVKSQNSKAKGCGL